MGVSMKYFKQMAFLNILFNVIFSCKLHASFTDLTPINLRTEYMVNPVIDSPNPRFSWELTSTKRGQNQTAFQIMIASA
jgi:alpha-L-rhamnosidase